MTLEQAKKTLKRLARDNEEDSGGYYWQRRNTVIARAFEMDGEPTVVFDFDNTLEVFSGTEAKQLVQCFKH